MIVSREEVLATWLDTRSIEQRNEVVGAYQFLCRRAAQRFRHLVSDARDVEQVASIGLIKACERYDRAYETPFEAYAWLTICGEIMHHLRDTEQFMRQPRSTARRARVTFVENEAELDGVAARGGGWTSRGFENDVILRLALSSLDDRERTTVLLTYAGHTQEEIARRIGCSQRHVSRIYRKATQKMADLWV